MSAGWSPHSGSLPLPLGSALPGACLPPVLPLGPNLFTLSLCRCHQKHLSKTRPHCVTPWLKFLQRPWCPRAPGPAHLFCASKQVTTIIASPWSCRPSPPALGLCRRALTGGWQPRSAPSKLSQPHRPGSLGFTHACMRSPHLPLKLHLTPQREGVEVLQQHPVHPPRLPAMSPPTRDLQLAALTLPLHQFSFLFFHTFFCFCSHFPSGIQGPLSTIFQNRTFQHSNRTRQRVLRTRCPDPSHQPSTWPWFPTLHPRSRPYWTPTPVSQNPAGHPPLLGRAATRQLLLKQPSFLASCVPHPPGPFLSLRPAPH